MSMVPSDYGRAPVQQRAISPQELKARSEFAGVVRFATRSASAATLSEKLAPLAARTEVLSDAGGAIASSFDERDDAVKAMLAMAIAACRKAGMTRRAWQDPATSVVAFRTARFGGPALALES